MKSEPSVLSIKDASGRHISLLNNEPQTVYAPHTPTTPVTKTAAATATSTTTASGRRRYHCTEPGCNKSFTTRYGININVALKCWMINIPYFYLISGHLARHNRIHTGEKNFHCLYPGCPSRFSRQDNMMQHYRTHMSNKSRRHPQARKPYVATPTTPTGIYHHHSHPYQVEEPYMRPPTRPHRAMTYPLPTGYPQPLVMLPKPQPMEPSSMRRTHRASSISSACSSNSSSSSSFFASSPSPTTPAPTTAILPPLSSLDKPQHHHQQQQEPTRSPTTGFLQFAHIVSTLG